MKPDTTLTLGDFEFAALEIPANIPFGGTQRLAVHELVGGAKVVDSMGRSDKPLTWSGMFMGSTSVDRARYLDTLRVAGAPLKLTWGAFNYQVVIRSFDATYEKSYLVPYAITCEVVQDNTSPATAPAATPVDKALSDDNVTAGALADSVGDATLSGLMGAVSSSISAVSSFAQATQGEVNSVLQPVAAAKAQVGILVASASNTISNVTTFGGVLPGNPVAVAAASLASQAAAFEQLNTLYSLGSVLGRMQNNLGAINASQRTVATAGGNLFAIAQSEYGDAAAWTGIAKANGLSDPFIQGARVLTVPPQAGNTTGILNP